MSQTGQGKWAGFREWANIMMAGGSLLVSIVSVWTATRVSDVQDFLESEIKRRNSELSAISERSIQAQRLADRKNDQLTELQMSTDKISATAVAVQRNLQTAQNDLIITKSESLSAKLQLSEVLASKNELSKSMDQLADASDFYMRRKAAEYAIIALNEKVGNQELSGSTGSKLLENVQSIRPSNDSVLRPYLYNIKSRMLLVCPDIPNWKSRVPPPLGEIDETFSYPKGRSFTEGIRQTTISEEIVEIRSRMTGCVCSSLANEKHDAAQICAASSDT